jgi:hypothetical protein
MTECCSKSSDLRSHILDYPCHVRNISIHLRANIARDPLHTGGFRVKVELEATGISHFKEREQKWPTLTGHATKPIQWIRACISPPQHVLDHQNRNSNLRM